MAWYSVVGGLLPKPSLALMRAAQVGDAARTRQLDASFAPLWDLFKRYGSIRVMYAAANLLRLTDAQPPRPILPLDRDGVGQVAKAMLSLTEQGPGG